MAAPNGHTNGGTVVSATQAEPGVGAGYARLDQWQKFSPEDIRRYTAELEMPLDPRVIGWRVTNTSHDKIRGQIIPYADQRAYTDRLNAVFTPAGWTRRYTIHSCAKFERRKDQKIVA